MEIIYFVSGTHRYEAAIYFGIGPRFACAFGWSVEPISRISSCRCDVAIIDNRLEAEDVSSLKAFLSQQAGSRFPIFFRVSDPDMPLSRNPCVKFIFECGDHPGVHFATTYDPAGPFKSYVSRLKKSSVVHLPYPYERDRELDIDMESREKRIFLCGANHRKLYPLRSLLRRRRLLSPRLRLAVHDLAHPGYPDRGTSLKHTVVRERFVSYAAQYTHFFLCPTVYESELAKYVECAYAGSVPIGLAPRLIRDNLKDCFVKWRGTSKELTAALNNDVEDMRLIASRYRNIMRQLRDPGVLIDKLKDQISRSI
jgi:hypothetical protein